MNIMSHENELNEKCNEKRNENLKEEISEEMHYKANAIARQLLRPVRPVRKGG